MSGTKSFTDAKVEHIDLAFLLLLLELISYPPDAFKKAIDDFHSMLHDTGLTIHLLTKNLRDLFNQVDLNDFLKVNEL